jgi:hypothetical protein
MDDDRKEEDGSGGCWAREDDLSGTALLICPGVAILTRQ